MESITGSRRDWRRLKEQRVETEPDGFPSELEMIKKMSNKDYDALTKEKQLALKQELVRFIISTTSLGLTALYFLKQIS